MLISRTFRPGNVSIILRLSAVSIIYCVWIGFADVNIKIENVKKKFPKVSLDIVDSDCWVLLGLGFSLKISALWKFAMLKIRFDFSMRKSNLNLTFWSNINRIMNKYLFFLEMRVFVFFWKKKNILSHMWY